MNKNPLYTENQAALFLGNEDSPFAVATLRRWRVEGSGPKFLKMGKSIRYRQSALDDYLNSCIRSSTTEKVAI